MKRFRFVWLLALLVLPVGCGDDTSGPEVPPVEVRLMPDSTTVGTNESAWFTATVENAGDTTVVWSVEGKEYGDSAVGFVSPTGRYTAPGHLPNTLVPVTVEVAATSTADPSRSATAYVTIESGDGDVRIEISPCEIELAPGLEQVFQALVENASDPSLTWFVDPVPGIQNPGVVDASGRYLAPEPILDAFTVLVRATSVEDASKSAVALIHLLPLPLEVRVSPLEARVGLGQRLTFQSSVENTSDTSLDWYVNDNPGGYPIIGTIGEDGVYKAPNALPDPAVVQVKAVSRRDPSKYAVAQVEIVLPAGTEAEQKTAELDRGGPKKIYVVAWPTASGGQAVEGLDMLLEWIEVPVQFQHTGSYRVAFRHASYAGVRVRITIYDAGPSGQDREWVLTLNGGCG